MGLIAYVYRDAKLGDCTNGGLSGRCDRLTVVNAAGPFDPTDDMPAVLIDSHGRGIVRAVPARYDEGAGQWVPDRPDGAVGPMFGGNYLAASDSRFRKLCERLTGGSFYGAVAIHDRFETPEQYEALSR